MLRISKRSYPLEAEGQVNRLKTENDLLKHQADSVASTEGERVSRPYSIGEHLIYQGTLYRVVSPICSGGMITPGTNCRPTTLADELKNLKGE